MGRILKRVPLDFDAPRGQIWGGYINPHDKSVECGHCDGTGSSPDYRQLESQWYSHQGGSFTPDKRGSVPFKPDDELVLAIVTPKVERYNNIFYGTGKEAIYREAVRMCEIWNSSWSNHLNEQDVAALVEAGRLMEFTSTLTKDEGWKKKVPEYTPTPKEVNEWSLSGLGHDSCNCWVVINAELKRLGLPAKCEHCKGEGRLWENEEDKDQYENWEEYEPPTGEGFQLWENTSEGSPNSPVFDTLFGLCEWCETEATTFANFRATAQEWEDMLGEGLVSHREGNMVFI